MLACIIGGALVVSGGAIAVAPLLSRADFFEGTGFKFPTWFFVAPIITGALICILSRWRGQGRFQGHHSIFATMIIVAVFLGTVLWPTLNPIRSPRYMMQDIRSIIGPTAELGLVSWKEQLLLYVEPPYRTFGRKTDHDIQLQAAVDWLRNDTENRWLLIAGNYNLGPFDVKDAVYRKNLHGRNWLLFRASDMEQNSG